MIPASAIRYGLLTRFANVLLQALRNGTNIRIMFDRNPAIISSRKDNFI